MRGCTHCRRCCFDFPMKHVVDAVQVQEQASVTAGGLMLPENAREKPISGTVIRTGPGKKDKDGTRKTPKVSHIELCSFGAKRLALSFFRVLLRGM